MANIGVKQRGLMMINKRVLCSGKVLAHKIIYCDTLLRKATGLIWRGRDSVDDTAWWFRFNKPKYVTVTMFMVFFPIDMIFLDKNGKIIELKNDLKPFRNYTTNNKIKAFLEVKQGIIKRYHLKKGMVILSK